MKSVLEIRQGTSIDPDGEITYHIIPSGPVQNLNVQSEKAT